jgi:hypothetical protein
MMFLIVATCFIGIASLPLAFVLFAFNIGTLIITALLFAVFVTALIHRKELSLELRKRFDKRYIKRRL